MPLAREPSPAGWESASADLFDALVRPVLDRLPSGATLIIVPDGPLALVPFGALRDRRSGRYLIEDHPVAVAPSATLAASFLADPARPTAPRHVLVSADPAAGQGVARLRDAREEASAVAACYPSAELLVGPNVRKADVLERLPGVDLWHFGGHAVVNREVPSLSRLLLGKTLQDSLFAQDVAGRHLDNLRVVVLATCEGAAGRVLRGEGVLNLARPFLAAGVKTVVAALWPVPDTSARPVFIMLHRALAEGLAPSAALQRAQVESIHTTNVAAWASLVSIGSPR
jgi:CHAT domain-containing protein